MVQYQSIMKVPVIWRGKKLVIEKNLESSLKELGEELQTLTNVKADTIRLIIPKSSSLLMPFSEEHSNLRLQDIGIVEGKPLRMMGVSENEIDKIHKDAKQNLRIAGFEEEEKRMKQRILRGPNFPLKLPQGPYVFCDFRTLELPGITLNPPPSEALKRMHMLASDPGIVAIMNKHRWRVGNMTEMAPVGYVGISPKCVLGFNKNHGEEISLRLRTDDLKGFRKYESIKKTLLHELAHMVFSEHDANFYALDKQLNQEAFALDWTKSRGHTLADTRSLTNDDMDFDFDSNTNLPHILGGESSLTFVGARIASITAAYNRLSHSSINEESSEIYKGETHKIPSLDNQDVVEPDPDDHVENPNRNEEPDPDDVEMIVMDTSEPDPDDSNARDNIKNILTFKRNNESFREQSKEKKVEPKLNLDESLDQLEKIKVRMEPDPDDGQENNGRENRVDLDRKVENRPPILDVMVDEPDPDDDQENNGGKSRGDLDRKVENRPLISDLMDDEPDPDDELRRIQDPAALSFNRLNKTIELLCSELNPSEAMVVLQTLFKIIRNVSENPNEMKYKRLRKGNPVLQRNIANYPAAMEILSLIGFNEEVITGESGNAESYLVLKRNDPGLLWLAKSSLESSISM